MIGKPKSIEGECNAWLEISDDFGDNCSTMRCSLPKGHEGPHRQEFQRMGTPVSVTWEVDERPCAKCLGSRREGWTPKQLQKADWPDYAFESPDCSACRGSGIRTLLPEPTD